MLNDLKRREAKVRRQYNEMMQKAGSTSRSNSALNRDSQAAHNDNGVRGRSGARATSANKLNAAADAQREEQQDKGRVEQLKRQIEMNNAEILDNWDQIGIIKRNIFRVVQARQQNLDPSDINQMLNSK